MPPHTLETPPRAELREGRWDRREDDRHHRESSLHRHRTRPHRSRSHRPASPPPIPEMLSGNRPRGRRIVESVLAYDGHASSGDESPSRSRHERQGQENRPPVTPRTNRGRRRETSVSAAPEPHDGPQEQRRTNERSEFALLIALLPAIFRAVNAVAEPNGGWAQYHKRNRDQPRRSRTRSPARRNREARHSRNSSMLESIRDNPPRAGSRHRYQNSASTTDRVYDPDPKPRLPYGHTPSETRRKGPGYHPRNLSPPPRNMPPSLGGPSADPHGSSNDGSLWRFRGTDSG